MRRKNEIAVDKILDCAKEEFMEKGFEGASMRTIAERAGYTTGMLYARFADKSQLFKELVDDAAEKLFRYFPIRKTLLRICRPNSNFLKCTRTSRGK